ncbi:MAG: HupE/UreJ family protein [Woeseia sp.]
MQNNRHPLVSIIVLLLAAGGPLLAPHGASAHEIPTDVVVQAWLKPEGDRLELLVRVPLEAMRDLQFPTYGPGYLDIPASDSMLRDAAQIWIANGIELYEGDRRLAEKHISAARIALPSDASFRTFETARESVTGPPLPDDTRLVSTQALLDVLIEVPVLSAQSEFSIDTELSRLGIRTVTVLRFVTPSGAERVFEFSGNPGLVRLDPRWQHAFSRFVVFGFEHILQGFDHLMFVLCLIIPFRRIRPLIVLITSFTVAHSITLGSAAFGIVPKALWFPSLIETLIAASIVYMALENIIGTRWQRRWIVAFAFGLVHGFGFSFALGETLQFAGSHLLTSLLAFNLGVELGQIFIVLLAVPLLNLAFSTPRAERIGTIILSAILAHSAWHWMSDRATEFSSYDLSLPVQDLALAAVLMRWVIVLAAIAAIAWVTYRAYRHFLRSRNAQAEKSML